MPLPNVKKADRKKLANEMLATFACLRVKPFDTATVEGRERERYRLAAWNALSHMGSAGMGLLAFAITVPLTLPYLGAERFGLWMTVASMAGMLSFLDLGVANGLVNMIAHASAMDDSSARVAQLVRRGLLLLAVIGAAVGIGFLLINARFPLASALRIQGDTVRGEAVRTLIVFFSIFALSIPLNGVGRILAGLQRTWELYVVSIVASCVSVGLVYAAAVRHAGVPTLLVATYGLQTVAPGVLLVRLLPRQQRTPPNKRHFHPWRADIAQMSRVGGLFFALQIGTMIGWGADAVLVSSVIGPGEAGKLAVVQRLFQFVTLPLSILNAPLWGAYADAAARDDREFIRRTLRRSLAYTLGVALIVSCTIFLAADWLLEHWTKNELLVPAGLIAGYAIWSVIDACSNAFAMYLNGTGVVRIQVVLVAVFCCVTLPTKLWLLHRLGVDGVVFGTLFAHSVTVMPALLLLYRRAMRDNSPVNRPAAGIALSSG
jgi:O-antigen/teichoic acid export membrane protein